MRSLCSIHFAYRNTSTTAPAAAVPQALIRHFDFGFIRNLSSVVSDVHMLYCNDLRSDANAKHPLHAIFSLKWPKNLARPPH